METSSEWRTSYGPCCSVQSHWLGGPKVVTFVARAKLGLARVPEPPGEGEPRSGLRPELLPALAAAPALMSTFAPRKEEEFSVMRKDL